LDILAESIFALMIHCITKQSAICGWTFSWSCYLKWGS